MKKRFIFITTLISFLSISIFLVIVSSILFRLNRNNIESNIKTYLNVIIEVYNGENEKEAQKLITKTDSDVRITFISLDGTVIYDTLKVSEENHLNRPEIKSLGSLSYRKSDTLGKTYLYIAGFKADTYIRVAIVSSAVNRTVYLVILYGIIILVAISLLTMLFINKYYKRMMRPLNNEINKLNEIASSPNINLIDDINLLSLQIDKVSEIINEKISSLKLETNKMNYILEHMLQGLLIINGNGKIILSNKLALEMVEYENEISLDIDYLYLIHERQLALLVDDAINNNVKNNILIERNKRYLLFSVVSLVDSFASVDDKNGVAVFIQDVTKSKQIEKMKSDFFQNASHELKSPLTTIIGYQQMIESGIISNKDDIMDATKNTIKEAKRINDIVIEMLDLSRLETKKKENIEQINLKSDLVQILKSFNPQLTNKNIKVILELNELNVSMGKYDLDHLISNLVDNAIKYNKNDGFIKISIKNNSLEIEDSGIGIEEKYYDRIFERFFRVDKAHSRAIGGTGLGLAIVKHICLNYDLKITVSSKINVGTVFTIDFSNVL